mmetsp:Transcript_21542/g.66425  ORF Transcript_21542/g.66425 Transcript_21542/m.66425 type:complete len:252 (-) Transcript_21542:7-762(-)
MQPQYSSRRLATWYFARELYERSGDPWVGRQLFDTSSALIATHLAGTCVVEDETVLATAKAIQRRLEHLLQALPAEQQNVDDERSDASSTDAAESADSTETAATASLRTRYETEREWQVREQRHVIREEIRDYDRTRLHIHDDLVRLREFQAFLDLDLFGELLAFLHMTPWELCVRLHTPSTSAVPFAILPPRLIGGRFLSSHLLPLPTDDDISQVCRVTSLLKSSYPPAHGRRHQSSLPGDVSSKVILSP